MSQTPKPVGVMVGYCHPGHIRGLFHDSLLGVLLRDHVTGGKILSYGGYAALTTGPRIASGRTQLVDAFLAHPNQPEWLWMLDTDMVFAPDTLDRLLDSADAKDRPIVGALCFGGGRDAKVFPTIYTVTPDGQTIDRCEDYPRDALCKIDATGAACILIHRNVFLTMTKRFPRPLPWFQDVVINGMDIGEDICFCLRARQCNIPIYVHTGIQIGHEKTQIITEESFDTYKAVTQEPVAA